MRIFGSNNQSKLKFYEPGSNSILITAIVMIVMILTPTVTADEKLPSGKEILEQYIKVTGGAEVQSKITNRIVHGTMEVVGMGLTGTVLSYNARPAKQYLLIESPAIGKMESGTDGEVFWDMSMMTGPRIKEGEEREMGKREADFDGLLNWQKNFIDAKCIGLAQVDSVECYKVVLTPKTGQPETMYFDKDKFLLIKTEVTMETSMGEIPMEVYISDYREIEGQLIAFRMKQITMGTQQMLMITDSIEFNGEIPEGIFDLPVEIKELVEKTQGANK